jgi:hypothetical protein
MASAAESELAVLFITAQEMIPHRQTLIAMGWPQPKTPIQTDNSTAVGVTNKIIVPRRAKMMDMRFWWLRCRASQDQFRYYWDAGSKNWADYHTKHHPDSYHEAHMTTHAGIWYLGTGWHLSQPPILPNQWPTGFPLQVFPFYFYFFQSTEHYFPTL